MKDAERKAQILLIEDNPADVDLFEHALAHAEIDCDVTVINDGDAGMSLARNNSGHGDAPLPDLAVLDLNLPKHGGLEILEAMRANAAFAELPVVVLSSSPSARDLAQLKRFHVVCYITKPPDLEAYFKIGLLLKTVLAKIRTRAQSDYGIPW
jgi:chemotaxis family two-component system response regulator Rcp1